VRERGEETATLLIDRSVKGRHNQMVELVKTMLKEHADAT